jgi:hypothetical protein
MNFDMTTIAEAGTSLKTATEIVKGLKGLKGTAAPSRDAEDKISELYGIILSAHGSALAAQTSQLSLLQTVRDLDKKISDFETWDREKTRYQMKDVNPGRGSVFVYALKPEAAGGDPPHFLCAKCFQHRLKSPLHGSPNLEKGQRKHFCPECKTEYMFGSAQNR